MNAKTKYPWAFEKEKRAEPLVCLSIQQVVNEAHFWLCIHSAILYGLMTGDAESINQKKCIHYLELGKKLGVVPDEKYISPDFKSN